MKLNKRSECTPLKCYDSCIRCITPRYIWFKRYGSPPHRKRYDTMRSKNSGCGWGWAVLQELGGGGAYFEWTLYVGLGSCREIVLIFSYSMKHTSHNTTWILIFTNSHFWIYKFHTKKNIMSTWKCGNVREKWPLSIEHLHSLYGLFRLILPGCNVTIQQVSSGQLRT